VVLTIFCLLIRPITFAHCHLDCRLDYHHFPRFPHHALAAVSLCDPTVSDCFSPEGTKEGME
jgi:hypothetical protein